MATKESKSTFGNVMVKFLIWRLKHIGDNNFLLIVAGFVGLFSGLAAVVLKSTVHVIVHYLELNINQFGFRYVYLGFPLIGIFLTVLATKYLFKESLGHGITHVLYAISKNSGIIRNTRMYSGMVTSAITVGFGGSVGLEAPIVLTGSAIGSNLARFFHQSYKKRTLLLGCGAAGAVSAIFNSPVTGVIFAMEVILTEVKINRFVPLLLASVMGQLVSIVLLGEDILFSFRLKDPFTAPDTVYYLIFGAICGLISLYFTRTMYFFERTIQKLKSDFVKALIGGLSLALLILMFPPIYGEGYTAIKSLLSDQSTELFQRSFFYGLSDTPILLIVLLIGLLLMKPIATALTIGSGGSGGIFAPSLFMGGLSGFIFSYTANLSLGTNLSTSNFTLVGMCGVMSGVLHAPLTAIFLIAEITSGYMLFVPLMLVSAISFSTISYFEKHSIYTKRLIEKGDLIQYDKDQIVLSLIDLNKVIEKDLLTIHPDVTLKNLVNLVKKSKRNIFPVVNEWDELEGIVTLDDIREVMFDREAQENVIIRSIMQRPPASVSPQEKMQSVMNKFQLTQAWNLPVIENNKYIGFISKSRIFNVYRNKLIRQSAE